MLTDLFALSHTTRWFKAKPDEYVDRKMFKMSLCGVVVLAAPEAAGNDPPSLPPSSLRPLSVSL